MLHHAYVATTREQGRNLQTLVYGKQDADGFWHHEEVTLPDGHLSRHIGFALTPEGEPVILSNWSPTGSARLLTWHQRAEQNEWQTTHVDLSWYVPWLDQPLPNTTGPKGVVIDALGNRHIVLTSDHGNERVTLYMAVDSRLQSIEQRVFPSARFLGFGLDTREEVHIAFI